MNYKYNISQEGVLEKLRAVLIDIDPDVGYNAWIKALMVIFYETKGGDDGLELANAWSSHGTKYKGFKDVEYRWNRFDLSYKNPVRMGTLIRMAK